MKNKNAKLEQGTQIALIVVSAIVVLTLIGTYIFFQVNPSTANTVTINGIGDIKATPDLVTVYFTVQTNGTTAEDAKDQNSVIVDNVITALVKQGFERKDITTDSFSIYQDYSWNGNKQIPLGYKATHNIKVELSSAQTDKIGSVIDAGVDAGASINYINFELSQAKQNELKAQALTQATQDARTKADAIASGLGKTIGKIVSVSSNEFNYRPYPLYSAMAGSTAEDAKVATTNIQPGQQDVSATVTVVYALR